MDDHPIWRDSLRRLFERKRAGRVIAEASDGDEAFVLARSESPDIVIMDVDLPSVNGIEATRRIHAELPGAKILVLSSSESREHVVAAVQAGASAYLSKTAPSSNVVDAVQRVFAGELVFPPALAEMVLEQLRGGTVTETPPAPVSPKPTNMFVREGEFWTLSFEDATIRMKDSKGLRYIADLIRCAGEGIHVMELVAAEGGFDPASSGAGRKAAAAGLGVDSGAGVGVLDQAARVAYRARLEDLGEQVEEAEAWHDSERASRAREEMEFIAAEIARAVGLGGRDRQAGSAAERARVNVSRAISSAIRRIQAVHPSLASHLKGAVNTGTFCNYAPDRPTVWTI